MSLKEYEEFSHSQKCGQIHRKNASKCGESKWHIQETTDSLDSQNIKWEEVEGDEIGKESRAHIMRGCNEEEKWLC